MEWHDHTTAAVLNPTEIKTWTLNVDSRFRDEAQSVSSTDFYIRLPRVYKNVIALKLTSYEIPNTWYAFSSSRNETSFTLSGTVVTISDGNYTTPDLLINQLNTAITAKALPMRFVAPFNTVTSRLTISSAAPFDMAFGSEVACGPVAAQSITSGFIPHGGGLGYLLGFTSQSYTGNRSYTGEYVVNTLRENYILLQLPELEMAMDSIGFDNTSIRAFAKIIIDTDKNALVYGNAGDAITRAIMFPQPTNLPGFRVKLVDPFGLPINLMADFSFTLEIQEVVSSKVYESYRTNLTA
jgi:hypothetical protein